MDGNFEIILVKHNFFIIHNLILLACKNKPCYNIIFSEDFENPVNVDLIRRAYCNVVQCVNIIYFYYDK